MATKQDKAAPAAPSADTPIPDHDPTRGPDAAADPTQGPDPAPPAAAPVATGKAGAKAAP
jgi:hypothetical protein